MTGKVVEDGGRDMNEDRLWKRDNRTSLESYVGMDLYHARGHRFTSSPPVPQPNKTNKYQCVPEEGRLGVLRGSVLLVILILLSRDGVERILSRVEPLSMPKETTSTTPTSDLSLPPPRRPASLVSLPSQGSEARGGPGLSSESRRSHLES